MLKTAYCLLFLCLFTNVISAQDSHIHLSYPTVQGSLPLQTWKDLRDKDIEKQDLDYSCGSAATATILRSFYGQAIYEKDILDEVIKAGDDGTASFADLSQAVTTFGFKAIGLTLSFDKLKQLQIPALVYLKYRDKDHFSVIRGIDQKGNVRLGDPSWGNRTFSKYQFFSMWETRDDDTLKGKVLLILPEDTDSTAVNQAFFRSPEPNTTAITLLTVRHK